MNPRTEMVEIFFEFNILERQLFLLTLKDALNEALSNKLPNHLEYQALMLINDIENPLTNDTFMKLLDLVPGLILDITIKQDNKGEKIIKNLKAQFEFQKLQAQYQFQNYERSKKNQNNLDDLITKLDLMTKLESQINPFLGLNVKDLKNGEEFFLKLLELLPKNFFTYDKNKQCLSIYENRQSRELQELLLSNWQLSSLFINKLVENAPSLKDQIMSSRLGQICQLDKLRKQVIPTDLRQRTPIEIQQRVVMQALQRRQEKPKPAVVMPDLKQGQRTMMVEKLADEGKLPDELKNDYDDLICPLSLALFADPVKVIQNIGGIDKVFYFEKSWIEQAVQQNGKNPMNQQPLSMNDIKPAPEKLEAVNAFKNKVMAEIKDQSPDNIPLNLNKGPR